LGTNWAVIGDNGVFRLIHLLASVVWSL
jgi:hypothetical protein